MVAREVPQPKIRHARTVPEIRGRRRYQQNPGREYSESLGTWTHRRIVIIYPKPMQRISYVLTELTQTHIHI